MSGTQLQSVTRVAVEPADAYIVVVEDNISNFMLVARMLSFMGVQHCEWKTTGRQVVQFVNSLPKIHLILLDIRLPYEDGYHVLKEIRANPRLKDAIVCAVTAEAGQEQARRAAKAGFDGFLAKPLNPDRFPEQIRRLLNSESVWDWH